MSNLIALVLLTVFLFYPLSGQCSPDPGTTDSLTELPSPKQISSAARNEIKSPEAPRELHRLDFRIEGLSCPACLHSIENKLKSVKGVQDAAVMLMHPFGASVIYQAEDTSTDYILAMIKVREPDIKVVDVNDSKIDIMPAPLRPKSISVVEPVKPAADSVSKPINSDGVELNN
jgi:copper chaperone CopZ